MKKAFYLFLLVGLALFSCKKDKKALVKPGPEPENKTYTVKFNVGVDNADLSVSSIKSSKKISAVFDISELATFLAYYVYNSNNQLITSLIQNKNTSNFGKITDSFAAGTYTIIVVATNGQPTEYDSKHLIAVGKDTFYEKTTLTVSASTITQNINLQRVNGQLEVKILDAIDDGTASIQYKWGPEYGLSLSNGLPDISKIYPQDVTKTIEPALYGTVNYTYATFVTNTVKPLTVSILVRSKTSGLYKTINIDSVMIYPNTRTVLSGNVFGGYVQQGFNTSYNEVYGSDTTVVNF